MSEHIEVPKLNGTAKAVAGILIGLILGFVLPLLAQVGQEGAGTKAVVEVNRSEIEILQRDVHDLSGQVEGLKVGQGMILDKLEKMEERNY